jgi:hypothetical protein
MVVGLAVWSGGEFAAGRDRIVNALTEQPPDHLWTAGIEGSNRVSPGSKLHS